MRPVEIGRQNDAVTHVISGLTEDEPVIVYPDDNLEAGTRVALVNESAPIGQAP